MSARGAPPTAPCKLCGTIAVLRWSHIISAWSYRRVIAGNAAGDPASPVRIEDGVAIARPDQDAEYMLCADCEQRLGLAEKYVASIAVQEDGSFPAHDATVPVPHLSDHEWQVGDASSLDCGVIAYFAASVIWRASVSDLFSDVDLGSKYNAQLTEYLLGRAAFPSNARLLVEFLRTTTGPRVERTVVGPESKRDGAFHVHQFALFGMWFRLMVGNRLPPEAAPLSFLDHRLVLLSAGSRLRAGVARKALAATPKGRLARR